LVTASIIKLPESLYASSVRSEKPYKNFAYNNPPIYDKGANPSIINVIYQLAIKEITNPQIKAPTLDILIPKIDEVSPLINLQSTDNLLVKVPALFFGISKYGIGILNNFLYVSNLNLQVSFSPTYAKKYI